VTADGAYDGAPTYQTIAQHGDGIEVVIPPRATAVLSSELDTPTQRDRHLAMIAEQGRLAWQASTGYGQRSLVETTMGRYLMTPLIFNCHFTVPSRPGLSRTPLIVPDWAT
jgi:hypothetical protein